MFNVGGGEVLVILLVALVVLGPTRLPGAARQVGAFLTEVRRMSNQFKRELKDAMPDEVVDLKRDLDDTRRNLRSMDIDHEIERKAREKGRAMLAEERSDHVADDTAISTAAAAGMFPEGDSTPADAPDAHHRDGDSSSDGSSSDDQTA